MERLKNKILKWKDLKGQSFRGIGDAIGVSKSTIERAVKGNFEIKFEVLLKLVKYLCDDEKEQFQCIEDYILNVSGNLNLEKVMCFCHVMGEYELLEQLIFKHEENIEVKKYITFYKIQNKRNKNEMRGQRLLDELYKHNISAYPECQVLSNILKMESMYDKQNYHAIVPFADIVRVELDKIGKEDEDKIKNTDGVQDYVSHEPKKRKGKVDRTYIKECLEMKFKERLAYIYLMRNDLVNCRKVCKEILSSKLDIMMVKATAWCCFGESFTFESLEKASKFIKKAISICKKLSVPQKAQKYIAFTSTLAHLHIENNYRLEDIDLESIHKSEKAYYECLYGNWQLGMKLYDEIRRKGFTSFQMYSYSKIMNDIIGLKKALELFELSGNIFYSQYVKRLLMKEEVKVVE
ncbi:helix-turn-helix transcriptional regulator [Bacillus thuringiensis]|uniref:AimR family lysis-lysogeny pheromone receptor n=1 Tax=Bacillus thuringiensis TaxID=1428 RepID=UPI0033369C6F